MTWWWSAAEMQPETGTVPGEGQRGGGGAGPLRGIGEVCIPLGRLRTRRQGLTVERTGHRAAIVMHPVNVPGLLPLHEEEIEKVALPDQEYGRIRASP